MTTPGDGSTPYRLTLVGNVPADIRELAKGAALRGRKLEYIDAWLTIEQRLFNDPNQFGECRYSLLKGAMKVCIGAIAPVAVQFAVHEQRREVFLLKVFLLGS